MIVYDFKAKWIAISLRAAIDVFQHIENIVLHHTATACNILAIGGFNFQFIVRWKLIVPISDEHRRADSLSIIVKNTECAFIYK